jgi:gamma-glutamylcyclotransferase (GGCT)/AIG2-like uncharacterized protein YtfP
VERPSTLFVYGTLLFEPVVRRIVGPWAVPHPARLPGYERWALRGLPYPAVVPSRQPASSVEGALLTGLDEAAWRRLDAYEDDFYDCLTVQVVLPTTEQVPSGCYVLPPAQRSRCEARPWDAAVFEREHLAAFLDRLQGS